MHCCFLSKKKKNPYASPSVADKTTVLTKIESLAKDTPKTANTNKPKQQMNP